MSTDELEPLLPDDAANRATTALVRPPGWDVKPSDTPYDLVAIGGGTGGLVTASGAAMIGAKAALIERARLGGDCLLAGCVPSKALLHASRVAHAARTGEGIGVHTDVRVDLGEVMGWLRRVRSDIAHDDSAQTIADRGADVIFGTAKFTGPQALEVDGAPLRFKRAVVATGGRPRVPDNPGFREHAHTNETIFALSELPARLLVIGGGPVGCELGQAFARFGSDVMLCTRAKQLLPADDADAGALVAEALADEGVDLRLQCEVLSLRREDGELIATVKGSDDASFEVRADAALLAVGREPNLASLDLDAAGVRYGARGIEVDGYQRTSNRRVFAVGDVTTGPKFTHAAYAQGEWTVYNALTPLRKHARKRVMTWCTFTDPEVAHAGLTPRELAALGDEVTTITLDHHHNDRMRLDGETRGFGRIHLRGSKIVAATFVCRNAGDVVAEVALAMSNGLGIDAILATIHPYPTRSWMSLYLANEANFTRFTPLTKTVLRWWMSLLR